MPSPVHEDPEAGPDSAVFGSVMLVLFLLSILYAVAVYFDWYRWLPGL